MKKKSKNNKQKKGKVKGPAAEKENQQLFWFVIVLVIVFALVLIPYFWIENSKSFGFGGAEWVIEEYAEPTGTIYHGRFEALDGSPELFFNVFLRGDPRTNDVPTGGVFDDFIYGGIVSMSPEVDKCRGELSRSMLDLGSFLRTGVGVKKLESGSTDRATATESGRKYAICGRVLDRTLVIVEIGEPRVVQHEKYKSCYTIYAESCDDVSSVEKFIVKTIDDFGKVNDE